MGVHIGVDGVAKSIKEIAVDVDGVARFVKKGYIGVDGVAKQFYNHVTYEKRLYFFGYTGTLGSSYTTNKLYSVKTDGTEPIEYTLETPIYAFAKTSGTSEFDKVWFAKLFYDPNTKRLCVFGVGQGHNSIEFYTIDCIKNEIIDHKSVFSIFYGTSISIPYGIYYSYEMGCVFFATGGENSVPVVCYNIRNSTITSSSISVSQYSVYDINGLYATPISNGARLVCSCNSGNSRVPSLQVYDFDLINGTVSNAPVTQSQLPAASINTRRDIKFIVPHSFINKNVYSNPVGICFVDTDYDNNDPFYSFTTTGCVVTKDGYMGNNFALQYRVYPHILYEGLKKFGYSNTHGSIWVFGTYSEYLGKYGTSFTSTTNPTGSMSNNSGQTYDGPVIGGGVITGYTSSSTAVIYANIAGSYYNITPSNYGEYNNPICDGINLKEIIIPDTTNSRFLVYDFNDVAYTTPISVSSAMSQFGISPLPYSALLSWTKEEQDALINLGY